MKMTPSRWAFVACLFFALVTVVFVILFGTAPEPAAPLHGGFRTPILALEFAREVSHLEFLMGEEGAQMREYLRRVQFLDIFFPVAYAGMAAAYFLGVALRGNFLALIGVGLALATILADWRENATIDDILDEIENPVCNEQTIPDNAGERVVLRDCLPESAFTEASPALELSSYVFDSFLPVRVEFLQVDTWVKWGLMAAYAALMSVLLWFSGRGVWYDWRRFLAVPPALAALAIGATWVSGSNGHAAEIMSVLLIPFMLAFPVAAVMYFLVQPKKGGRKKRARQPQVEDNP
jgi:hypothetical protein